MLHFGHRIFVLIEHPSSFIIILHSLGHRMENLHGMRKHKIGRKKHKTVSSVVYIGKSDKAKRKYFNKPSKKVYDHSPHEVGIGQVPNKRYWIIIKACKAFLITNEALKKCIRYK